MICYSVEVRNVSKILCKLQIRDMCTVLTLFFLLLTVPPRWPTRVFAAESVRRVIQVCDGNTVHFDIEMAREMRTKTGGGKTDVMHFAVL